MLQSIILNNVNLKYDSMPKGVEHDSVKYFSLLCNKRYRSLMPRGDPKPLYFTLSIKTCANMIS
jgi:hypothetical protein